jgi:hypothetical protein
MNTVERLKEFYEAQRNERIDNKLSSERFTPNASWSAVKLNDLTRKRYLNLMEECFEAMRQSILDYATTKYELISSKDAEEYYNLAIGECRRMITAEVMHKPAIIRTPFGVKELVVS